MTTQHTAPTQVLPTIGAGGAHPSPKGHGPLVALVVVGVILAVLVTAWKGGSITVTP